MTDITQILEDLDGPITDEIRTQAASFIRHLESEVDRLQRVIDSRPAINCALPDSYIQWSQGIYAMEISHGSETKQ